MFNLKSLATRHDMIMYICCVLAFIGVAGNGVGVLFAILFMGAWVISWGLFQTGRHRLIPIKVWNVVILTSVAGTGAMMYFSEESVINSGVRFILMLIAIKLLSRRGDERDDWQIYALTFLLMAAGTAVNEDLIYGFVFALYVLFGTFGLALLHLRTEQERTGSPPTSAMHKSYGRILMVLAGMVFLSSMVIFFTFPRVGLGFFATKTRANVSMTGFSDKVELGSHGIIRSNPEVVMRVKFEDDVMPMEALNYHWRMMSFDRYNGVQWSRSRQARPLVFSRISTQPPIFDTRQIYTPQLREQLDTQTRHLDIYMEPLEVKQVPQLWPMTTIGLPESITLTFNPNSIWLRHDTFYHDMYMEQRNELGIAFSMEVPRAPSLEPIKQAAYEPMEPMRYQEFTQMPPGMERLIALTTTLTQNTTSPHDKARLIEQHLQTSYSYTTDLPAVEGDNPVESFLFTTKRGHCEFFATTMVLMMRSQDIPARLVNGFLGGSWNSTGNYMAVRQGDAHSWVEVYLPEYGWVPFDPTPSSGTQPLQNDDLAQQMRDIYDAARMRWMQWVIEYNLDAQIAGLRRLSEVLSPKGGAGTDTKTPSGEKSADASLKLSFREVILWTLLALFTLMGMAQIKLTDRQHAISPRSPGDHRGTWFKIALALCFWPALGAAWFGLMHDERVWIFVGAMVPCAGMMIMLSWRARLSTTPTHRVHILFMRVEQLARRHGITRHMDEGPQQFLSRLITAYPAHGEQLARFTRRYLQARFGEVTQEEIMTLEKMTGNLLTQLRRSAPPRRAP